MIFFYLFHFLHLFLIVYIMNVFFYLIINFILIVLLSSCHISPFKPISQVQLLYFKSILKINIEDEIVLKAFNRISNNKTFINFNSFLSLQNAIPELFEPLERIRISFRQVIFTLGHYNNILSRNYNINYIKNYYKINHSYPKISCFKYFNSWIYGFGNPYQCDFTFDDENNHDYELDKLIRKCCSIYNPLERKKLCTRSDSRVILTVNSQAIISHQNTGDSCKNTIDREIRSFIELDKSR